MKSDLNDNLEMLEEVRDQFIDAYWHRAHINDETIASTINYLSYQINQMKNEKSYKKGLRII